MSNEVLHNDAVVDELVAGTDRKVFISLDVGFANTFLYELLHHGLLFAVLFLPVPPSLLVISLVKFSLAFRLFLT